jgi:hypothetical protein
VTSNSYASALRTFFLEFGVNAASTLRKASMLMLMFKTPAAGAPPALGAGD